MTRTRRKTVIEVFNRAIRNYWSPGMEQRYGKVECTATRNPVKTRNTSETGQSREIPRAREGKIVRIDVKKFIQTLFF